MPSLPHADDQWRRRARPCFGTLLRLSMRGCGTRGETDEVMDRAFALAREFHDAMSCQDAHSDLAAIRRLRPGENLEVRPLTEKVLKFALQLAEDTDGLFDPVAPSRLSRKASWRDLMLTGDRCVSVRQSLVLTLDGVAKGYAADSICALMSAAADGDVMVDAGGDIAIHCATPQRVGVRDPRAPGRFGRHIEIGRGGVASSGGYNGTSSFWDRRGRRRRGAATVTAPSCAIADAMTKVALSDPTVHALARWDAAVIMSTADGS